MFWYSYLSSINFSLDSNSELLSDPDAPHWKEFDEFLDVAVEEKIKIDGEERLVLSQYHQLSDAQDTLLLDGLGVLNVSRMMPHAYSLKQV